MKLGANSVLFSGYDMRTAFHNISRAGYDGIELSAIAGMDPHLILDRWQAQVPEIRSLAQEFDLELLAMEQPDRDLMVMEKAMEAASALGIPIINCGPGGQSDDPSTTQGTIDELSKLAEMAESYGVVLCVKAHVGRSIYNTPTTLQAMSAIPSSSFGIDMDPSHIYRAVENPVEAIAAVIERVRHVHIRDCRGRQQGPGRPEHQANGRGDIDLVGYIRVLHEHGYAGPVNLEIIGAGDYPLEHCCTIAAEARGHMQACLQACHAR